MNSSSIDSHHSDEEDDSQQKDSALSQKDNTVWVPNKLTLKQRIQDVWNELSMLETMAQNLLTFDEMAKYNNIKIRGFPNTPVSLCIYLQLMIGFKLSYIQLSFSASPEQSQEILHIACGSSGVHNVNSFHGIFAFVIDDIVKFKETGGKKITDSSTNKENWRRNGFGLSFGATKIFGTFKVSSLASYYKHKDKVDVSVLQSGIEKKVLSKKKTIQLASKVSNNRNSSSSLTITATPTTTLPNSNGIQANLTTTATPTTTPPNSNIIQPNLNSTHLPYDAILRTNPNASTISAISNSDDESDCDGLKLLMNAAAQTGGF